MRAVLVIGGSGAVGGFLLDRLLACGRPLVALSRAARAPRPGLRWVCGGLDAAFAAPWCSAIVCAGPLDQFVAWLEQARPVGVERIVALSSMSAASKHASPDPAERELAARLVASEQRLARYCRDGGIAWCVLRPTLIYGAGVDRSLSPIARWARLLRLFPCLPAATGLRQPVHADDVAAACVAALEEADGEVYELGGGERLSYAAMLARLRDSLDRRTLAVPLPIYLLRMLARLTGRGNGMVQRLTQDLIADNSPVERRFGLRPRPFRPRAECWRSASSPSDP